MSNNVERNARVLRIMEEIFSKDLSNLEELKSLDRFYSTQMWIDLLEIAFNRVRAAKILKEMNDGM